MKQLTRSEFNKQGTTYKSVTSPASDDEVTQITDVVENNGNFSYSTDGSSFKTITNEIQKIADVTDIYPSPNALPVLGAEDDGVIYGTLNNGVLPLDLYKYSAATSSWQYVDTAKEGALYIDSATGLIYQFSQNSPYFYVTSYTKISQLANDVDFLTGTEISAQISDAVSEEATARQNADTTLQNNINNAVSTTETAMQELHTAIQNEASARQTADATLQSNIDAKQDELTAGANITIENNVISATVPQIAVDSELSTTSENPVQNKVVTNALNGKMDSTNPTGTGSLSINRKANTTVGRYSTALGVLGTASGEASHAEGFGCAAVNSYSHAEGQGTHTSATAQHVFGKYNKNDANCVEIVGNGTGSTAALSSNARTLDWSGNEVLSGTSQATGFKTPNGTSAQFLKADGSVDTNVYATSTQLNSKQDALTTTQLDAVNSGINDTLVTQISTNQTDIASEITARQNADTTLQQNINAKYTKPSAGIPASDLASAVQTSLGKADTALQSINSSDVTTALGFTPYNSTNPSGYTKVEASSTNGNIKINGSETNVYTLPSDIATDSDVSAVQSNLNAEITAREGADTTLQNNINTINGKIPSQASTTNQLADKDFVNSSINAFAAYYITKNAAGDPFATKAELTGASTFYSGGAVRVPTTNDYCIVLADESKQSETGVDPTTRYSYQGNQWEYQYTVNDTPLTAVQLAALNSGITSADVTQITTNASNITSLQSGKQDALNTAQLNAVNSGITSALVTQIGTNTTNIGTKQDAITSTNKLDADLVDDATSTNKFVTSAEKTTWNGKQNALNTNQLNAVNSGVTSATVSQVATNTSNITSLQTSKQDKLSASALSYYGTCTTAAATQAKVVDCTGFVLETGVSIRVKFTNAQTYNGAATLNVNSTGAKSVKSVETTNSPRYCWLAGEVVDFVYDGTNYVMVDGGIATTTYYGHTKLASTATSTNTSTALTPASLNNVMQDIVTGYPVYSASSTYAVGDRVRYSWYVYECNTAITTAEAWTAAHWTQVEDLQTQIDNKQDKLTAGANITISNNVISASGGGTATNVKVDDVSITSNNEANIVTKSGDYNSTSNRFLTENDVKEYTAAEIEAMFN